MNIVFLGMQAMRSDLGTITETVKKALVKSPGKDVLIEKLSEADALIEDMSESSSAAVLVLNDLINYDKIENRTLVIEAKQVFPLVLLTSTIRSLQVQAKQAHVKLELVTNWSDETNAMIQKDISIIGDHVKLSQVIRNIVSNALKFSNPGDIVKITGNISLLHC